MAPQEPGGEYKPSIRLQQYFFVLSGSDSVFLLNVFHFKERPQHWPHSSSRKALSLIRLYVIKIGNYQNIFEQ